MIMSDVPLAENSTEDFRDPLEGTSVWIWNNTGLVSLNEFSVLLFVLCVMFRLCNYGCSNRSFNLVCGPGEMGPKPVTCS